MSVYDDILSKLKDLERQVRHMQRLDVNPPASFVTTYFGTPVAGNYVSWRGAGTVQDSGFGTSQLPRYSGTPTAGNVAGWVGPGTVGDAGYGTAAVTRYSGTPTADALAYWTGAGTVAGSRTVYVNSGGSVGIGTATPGFLLHLFQNVNAATRLRINNAGTSTAAQSGFDFSNDAGHPLQAFVTGTGFTPTGLVAADMGYLQGNQIPLLLRTIGAQPIIFGVNSSVEAMRILSSGVITTGGLTSAGASQIGVEAGTSGDDAAVGGVMFETTTQTGNVGTGEDVLASYGVPANTLAANGQSLWFEAAGTFGGTTNSVTLRLRFGTAGTNLVVSYTTTASNGKWLLWGRVVRTGSATQKAYAEIRESGGGGAVGVVTNLNQTLSGAVTLEVTGDATSNNDVVLETFTCGWDDANS